MSYTDCNTDYSRADVAKALQKAHREYDALIEVTIEQYLKGLTPKMGRGKYVDSFINSCFEVTGRGVSRRFEFSTGRG